MKKAAFILLGTVRQSSLLALYLVLCTPSFSQQTNYAQYVDPMIGTGGHGHTFPGATVPFGMVQLSPDTRIDDSWDGCSGYHSSDEYIYGFSHTHLSGTGCSDYGDFNLFPTWNDISYHPKSKFSHKNEKTSAGYYSIDLEEDHIKVELTATQHVGFHKYTFGPPGVANIFLDLEHRDKLVGSEFRVVNDSTVDVFRNSKAWASNQMLYAHIVFSKKFMPQTKPDKLTKNALFQFYVNAGESILVKVSLSAVDFDGAKKNMDAELPGWDFEKVKKDAEALWNKELGKIEITASNPDLQSGADQLKIFYTALYHCMIQPNIYSDVDHRYRGRDNKIHTAEGFDYYTVFSLWDTFRAEHPLFSIIDTKRTSDFINTFIAQYEQGGKLPVWELSSNETECMIGYHCVSVIADAMVKGIKGFDYEKAYNACKHSAMLDSYGLKAYKEKGFIETQDENENVSRTLEYAYDDWCIAQMARIQKKDSDYMYFIDRSQNWRNVFDGSTGFMRPRKNGGWLTPFDPKSVDNNYTEGNAWQYTFFVPQDVQALVEQMGGSKKFESKLDELFSTSSQTTGRDQPDISGLIGQYAHGNEPSHHMAYLYNYIGKPEKTQAIVHKILTQFYKTGKDGLIGNEDCGQMSAWYVLSSLGFYQVTPGSQQFISGSPLFKSAVIHLENGKNLNVSATNTSANNFYVKESNFGGLNHDESYLSYMDIMNGGNFNFDMSATPEDPIKHSWGRPIAFYRPDTLIPAPVFMAGPRIFSGDMQVDIVSPSGDSIFYLISSGPVDQKKMVYHAGTSTIFDNACFHAYCKRGSYSSKMVTATYHKRSNNWKLQLISKYDPQYTADGDDAVIDEQRGDLNWRKGGWQGYEGKNFECVIDLREKRAINSIQARFLQDQGAWIMMPAKVEYYISDDGVKFSLYSTIVNTVEDKDTKVQMKEFSSDNKKPLSARYVKVIAYSYGRMPAWHEGAGSDSWIFIDEISIK